MTDQGTRAMTAASSLREALEHTAAALANPRLETLLTGESAIEAALSSKPIHDSPASTMQALDTLPAEERLAVRRELERARDALLRCRRLGTSLREYIRLSFEAQGRGVDYGPRPSAGPAYAGQALNERV